MTVSHPLGTPDLRFDRRGPVAWCTVDRPQSRNALTAAMYEGIGRAIHLTATDDALRALVLTGAGDVFVAGGDMAEADGAGDQLRPPVLPFAALRNARVPVVVAVNGACVASGVLMAMLSDIAVASDRATFRVPELVRGFPDMWLAAVLPAHVGVGRARELFMTGRRVDAHEALAIGLVERVVPHEELAEAAGAAALELLEAAPEARLVWRRAVNDRYGVVDEVTQEGAAATAEVQEGFRSFLEKRPPSWSSRALPPG